MPPLCEEIQAYASALPEGTPVAAKSLLHLGSRAALDQALSRMVARGLLVRTGRGIYLAPVVGRFGSRLPSVEHSVEALSAQRGEVIVSSGATAANALGYTTQVPVRPIFFTSGRSRKLKLGKQEVELRHVPHWQLALAQRPAGQVLRALAWLGPENTQKELPRLKLERPDVIEELVSIAPQLPTWLARCVVNAAYA